jgi:integrase
MSTPVKVKIKVVKDNSGLVTEIPMLITKQGALMPLLNYLLSHSHDRIISWMTKVVHGTYLLMQYMEANQDCFHTPDVLFHTFAVRLYSGTIGDDGFDPSDLYWLPVSTDTANATIVALNGLTDFISNESKAKSMNPLRTASSYEERLNYAAWYKKNSHHFLGHIKNKTINHTAKQARNLKGRRGSMASNDDSAISFNEKLFARFYSKGMGGGIDIRSNLRNQLILLMMHFAGCRESDCLHLWVEDVFDDPFVPGGAIIRLYHPEDGASPNDWRSKTGQKNRAAYLREKYALTARNRVAGTQRVGWKTVVTNNSKEKYIQLFWFPQQTGVLFRTLWDLYCRYLLTVERHHPYAFVSFQKSNPGSPYTLNSFHDAYKKALNRIGKAQSKADGLSPHAHRHAMGRRMENADVNPRIIQKVLHHSSIESQIPYTTPNVQRVTQALNQSYTLLEQKIADQQGLDVLPDWHDILKTGFEDIDPNGLFSGFDPMIKGSINGKK